METQTPAAVEAADPTQAAPAASPTAADSGDADMAAALKAFRSAVGAPAPEAPAATEKPADSAEVPSQGSTVPAPPDASQAPEKPSADIAALMARMTRFEDESRAAAARAAELQTKLDAAEKQLTVKDPIEFLKQKGFTRDQIEDYLLNGDKSQVAQKSEMDLLKERVARFEAAEQERVQRSQTEQAESKRAAAESQYKTNVLTKAMDAAKYPLLHQVHTQDEILNMAFAQAVQHYQRTGGQEPNPADLFAGMERALTTLRDKLAPKAVVKTAAPSLSEIASHSEAGTGGTEQEDDAAALRSATALAAQMLAGKK